MKTSKFVTGTLTGLMLLQFPAVSYAGTNLDAYQSDQEPQVDATGMFITGAAKGAAGAGMLYYGFAKDPHVRAAIRELKNANSAVDDAKGVLEEAKRIVEPSVKAAQVAQAQEALKAANATVEAVSKTVDWGELAKGAMKVGGAIAGAENGLKNGDSGIGVAFDASMGKMNGEIAGDLTVGETRTEKAQSALEEASNKMAAANRLKTGSKEEIAKAIEDAQKGIATGKSGAVDAQKALDAAKLAFGPKGLAKGMKVLAVVGGVVLITDTAMQGVYFINGSQSYTPTGDWLIKRGKTKSASKLPRDSFVDGEDRGAPEGRGFEPHFPAAHPAEEAPASETVNGSLVPPT